MQVVAIETYPHIYVALCQEQYPLLRDEYDIMILVSSKLEGAPLQVVCLHFEDPSEFERLN